MHLSNAKGRERAAIFHQVLKLCRYIPLHCDDFELAVQGRGQGPDLKEAGSMWRSWTSPVLIAICILLQLKLVFTCTGECFSVLCLCFFYLGFEGRNLVGFEG